MRDELQYLLKSLKQANTTELMMNHYGLSLSAPTNGQLSKCWIQKNGKSILFKGANTIYRFEAVCEVIASRMHEILKIPYVNYQCLPLSGTKSTTLVSACPVMI